MKKYFLLIFIIIFSSCQPRITNDVKTLNKVFNMSSFDIEIQNWGCFGGTIESFDLSKKKNGYLLKSNRTKKNHIISQIKIDSLKDFLQTRILKEESLSCSTSMQYVRLGSLFNSISYTHSYCSEIDEKTLNSLLNYNSLIDEAN